MANALILKGAVKEDLPFFFNTLSIIYPSSPPWIGLWKNLPFSLDSFSQFTVYWILSKWPNKVVFVPSSLHQYLPCLPTLVFYRPTGILVCSSSKPMTHFPLLSWSQGHLWSLLCEHCAISSSKVTWFSSCLQTLYFNNSKEESELPKETSEPTLVLINHGIANKPWEPQPVTGAETENF